MLEGLLARASDPVRRAGYEADLSCPTLPMGAVHAYGAFKRLRRRKGSNGFALSPIEWPDIDAFLRLSGVPLTPFEIELIEDLDDLFMAAHSGGKTEPDDTEA